MLRLTACVVLGVLTSVSLLTAEGAAPQGESQSPSQIEPTELEAFAARSTAMVVWASPVGRLASAQSRAVVTAIALEDRETQVRMRGLRIDLIHLQPDPDCRLRWVIASVWCARENAAIYLEEDVLGRVREGVERGNAERNLIISFRRSAPEPTIGLIIGGYRFDGLQRVDLTSLIDAGIAELTKAPR